MSKDREILLSYCGTHAIFYREVDNGEWLVDDTDWHVYHPIDDDFGMFWFTSGEDAYRVLNELQEAEAERLEMWDETIADDDDAPFVMTHYKVMRLVDDGDPPMPHHRATVDSTFCCACGETWPCLGAGGSL